jgi:ankyrin repeat protein
MPLTISTLLTKQEETVAVTPETKRLLTAIYNPVPVTHVSLESAEQDVIEIAPPTSSQQEKKINKQESVTPQSTRTDISRQAEKKGVNLGPPVTYKNQNDFNVCKKQLLYLLDYIYRLNPEKLQQFLNYKNNIAASLSKKHPENDIKCTLLQAKTAIEDALPSILANHHRLADNALERFEVKKCFPGASANINEMLKLFYSTALSNFITQAKREIILQSAVEYIKQAKLLLLANNALHIGNEIHVANGLFNFVADQYGLIKIHDPTIPHNLIYDHNVLFASYVELRMTLPSIVYFITEYYLPLPDLQTMPVITDFFTTFLSEEENNNKHKRQFWDALYIMGEDYQFTAKNNIEKLYKCYVVFKLSQLGLIEGYKAKIGDKELIFDGRQIYIVNQPQKIINFPDDSLCSESDFYFTPLTDENMEYILQHQTEIISTFGDITGVVHGLSIDILISSGLIKNNNIFKTILENKLSKEDEETLAKYILCLSRFELNDEEARNILFAAAAIGAAKVVEAICTKKRRVVKAKDAFGHNVIHVAASAGHANTLEIVLNFLDIYDVNDVDNNGETALHKAANNGHLEVVNVLLRQSQIQPNLMENATGYSPLHQAAVNGHVDVVKRLLQVPNVKPNLWSNIDGVTPLHLAAMYGQAAVVALLLQELSSKQIEQATNDLQTALHLAIKYGHSNVVAEFIKQHPHKLNLDKPEFIFDFDLSIAIQFGRAEIVAQLLPIISASNLNFLQRRLGETMFQTAVRLGNVEIVKELLKYKDKINLKILSSYGASTLQIAVAAGHAEIIKLLLPLLDKTTINATNGNRFNKYPSALELAVQKGYVDVIAAFNKYPEKTDINAANKKGRTVLHVAIFSNNDRQITNRTAVVKELLKHPNIDINVANQCEDVDDYGFTALTYAIFRQSHEIIKMLCQHSKKLNVNEELIFGHTLLEYAAMDADIETILILLQYSNIKVDLNNKTDAQALMLAKNVSPRGAEIVSNFIKERYLPEYIKEQHAPKRYSFWFSLLGDVSSDKKISAAQALLTQSDNEVLQKQHAEAFSLTNLNAARHLMMRG